MSYLYYPLPAGIIVTIIFYFALPSDGSYPRWSMLLTVLGVIAGLMWTYIIIELLIDILDSFGILLNLDKAYLGLTILAVGNALPDALTTISLSAKGQAVMAISGGYAGQLFGYLVGFGISMLKQTLIAGPQTFNIFDFSQIQKNLLSLMVLITAAITLLSTFIFGIKNKF